MSGGETADWPGLVEWSAHSAGLALTAAQVEQLRRYLETLLLWNRKLALVSQRDVEQILAKHFADSLFAAAQCDDGASIIDLGSGAGFPGLAIAIARPAASISLVEARGKKATFLEEACRCASIRNAAVHAVRMEALAAEAKHRGAYAIAIARALTDTASFLALARPFLQPASRAIAMRAVGEDHDTAPSDATEIGYQLPDGTPRRLLVCRF